MVSPVKCVVCGNSFHLSYAKLNNNVDNIVVETFKLSESDGDGNAKEITDTSFSEVEAEGTVNEPQDDTEEHFLMQCLISVGIKWTFA